MSASRHLLLFGLALAALFLTRASVTAAEPSDETALVQARHDCELAELRLREYVQVECVLTLRRLDNKIKLVSAELEMYERQLRELGPSSSFRYSGAFRQTVEHTRLAELETRLKLADLQEEKFLFQRHRGARQRLLELELKAATERVLALEDKLQPEPQETVGN